MAVKSFFKWVIMRYEDWRDLENENDRLSNAVKVRDEQIERLNKRLDAIKNGERCISKHCDSCENACKVRIIEHYRDGWPAEKIDVVCALDAACPDYKRQED